MNPASDTIAAIATPPGTGGVGVIRISGDRVPAIAGALLGGLPAPRRARFCRFLGSDQDTIDSGLALYFPAPHSFTGEHVLELQGHGGPVIMNLLLQRVLSVGARLARPGEFSERAFLNDKLDLAQAEAIADLIESGTEASARAAQRSLQGVFSEQVSELLVQLVELRTYVESAIDFPDEEVDFLADAELLARLQSATEHLDQLLARAQQGQLLRDGVTLAIVGRPNAGKSSLLNALAGRDTAIVTDIPGTTRDILREQINLDGMPVHLVDTAGLRETVDVVEAEGVRRARASLREADLILLVVDLTQELIGQLALRDELPARVPAITVFNKKDLANGIPESKAIDAEAWLSAKTGDGLEALKRLIRRQVGAEDATEGSFTARTRHLDALGRDRRPLAGGARQLTESAAGELLAEELRQAQQALSEITGEYTSEDLLGRIFSSFCIGK